jgi:hypothetical protein
MFTMLNRRANRHLACLGAGLALAAVMLAPATSSAYVGEGKSLPYFHGSAYVKVTGWAPSGTATWRYGSGSYCVYIQYKHTAILGVDGSWHRLTSDNCGAYTSSASWSQPTSLPYNGIKFRLCQNVAYLADPCGDAVNIGIS